MRLCAALSHATSSADSSAREWLLPWVMNKWVSDASADAGIGGSGLCLKPKDQCTRLRVCVHCADIDSRSIINLSRKTQYKNVHVFATKAYAAKMPSEHMWTRHEKSKTTRQMDGQRQLNSRKTSIAIYRVQRIVSPNRWDFRCMNSICLIRTESLLLFLLLILRILHSVHKHSLASSAFEDESPE